MVYVKAVHKIDRLHQRFAGKKRNWLLRQIDPAKKYMHMLQEQAGRGAMLMHEGSEMMDDIGP